jgi:tripartite ATP-independent transporter DctP family solute receptor
MLARRHLLLAGATLAATTLAARPMPAKAAARTLRIGYILPAKSQLGAGAAAFAEAVGKRTDGRIVLQQFPDATLGGDVELLKGVQLGSIDLAFVTGMGLSAVLPEAGMLNIPFLFNSAQHAYAVLDGPVGQSFGKLFAAKDIVMLAWGENGLRHLTNAKGPIVTPDDLKGLKIRVPQSEVMLKSFQALGAEAGALPLPQLFEALRAGKFDGQENPIATIQAARFDQVQKYLSLSGHAYDPAVFVMSPDAFEDLSAEDKVVFKEAAVLGGKASRSFAAQAQIDGVAALRQAGMVVQTEIDRAAFAAAMGSVNAEFEQRFDRALIGQIRATA